MIETFHLRDGRTLTFRQYGKASGEPVLFFHGWPGESHQAAMLHEAAERCGARIISPNRPGIGGSTRQPERGLLDWPPMVAALADELGITRFRILGLSGGGPYAHACAWALDRRVIAYATVCGALPAAPGASRRKLSPVYQGMLAVNDHAPWLLQGALVPAVRIARVPLPRPLLWLGLRTVGQRDRQVLWSKESFARYFPSFQNAMRSGMSGLFDDGKPYSSPWPFDPAEIRTPLTIWHGREDRNFSFEGAAEFARQLPQARFILTDDGHYSILPNQGSLVLEDLLKLG